jgi:uncharacterized protein YbaR (Trm112 family)
VTYSDDYVKEEFKLIKLQCPECYSEKVVFVSSELNEEDCFQCEDCSVVYPLSEMAWESE